MTRDYWHEMVKEIEGFLEVYKRLIGYGVCFDSLSLVFYVNINKGKFGVKFVSPRFGDVKKGSGEDKIAGACNSLKNWILSYLINQ